MAEWTIGDFKQWATAVRKDAESDYKEAKAKRDKSGETYSFGRLMALERVEAVLQKVEEEPVKAAEPAASTAELEMRLDSRLSAFEMRLKRVEQWKHRVKMANLNQ